MTHFERSTKDSRSHPCAFCSIWITFPEHSRLFAAFNPSLGRSLKPGRRARAYNQGIELNPIQTKEK